jgi:hypothetical protein
LVWHFNIWLFLDAIEVLMDEIEQVVKELTSILLSIAAKPSNFLAKDSLEIIWCCPRFLSDPEVNEERVIGLG